MARQIIDLAGQITFGSTMMAANLVKIISSPEVYTFEGPRQWFSRFLYFFTHTGDLTCGREIDLSWCNVDTLRISTTVTGKDLPEFHESMSCLLNTSPGDFIETNKKLYLQFKMEEQKHGTVSFVDTDSDECDITVERIPPCQSIVDVLMKKKNTFPPLKPKATKGPAKQYNAIIEFITKKKFGVQA